MKTNTFIIIEITLITILILALAYAISTQHGNHSTTGFNSQIRFKDACKFLESQEVDGLGLLAASNNMGNESNKIYLLHDNYLAEKALAICNSSLAERINENLLTRNIAADPRYDVLFGQPYPYEKVYCWDNNTYMSNETINNKTYVVIVNYRNASCIMKNWTDYADWVALMGLNDLLNRNTTGSLELYDMLLGMWDGYGFNDTATRTYNRYDVYKVALAVYFYRTLKANGLNPSDVYLEDWLGIISNAQSSGGGFYTDYSVHNDSIVYGLGVNVETTSLVIISLNYPPLIVNTTK